MGEFTEEFHNLTRICHNLTRTCHNLTRTCHNLTRTCHNLTRTCHNFTRILSQRNPTDWYLDSNYDLVLVLLEQLKCDIHTWCPPQHSQWQPSTWRRSLKEQLNSELRHVLSDKKRQENFTIYLLHEVDLGNTISYGKSIKRKLAEGPNPIEASSFAHASLGNHKSSTPELSQLNQDFLPENYSFR